MAAPPTNARPGPKPGASPDDVLAIAGRMMLSGELPDIVGLSQRSGVGRTSIYRWFGSRDELLAEAVSRYLVAVLEDAYKRSRTRGPRRIARAVEVLIRGAATRDGFLAVLREHPQVMLDVIMNPTGAVHSRSVSTVQALIEREKAAGRYEPPLDPHTLAYILVQIGQSYMWARAATGAAPDADETMRVTEALLLAHSPA